MAGTAAPILLLDGGTGQELMRRSARPAEPLWSARTLEREPELVVEVHAAFIAAGARIVTLASYAATPERLAEAGEEGRFDALQRAACVCALRARDRSGADVAIAGCLPPLVRSYRPDLVPPRAALVEGYRRIVAAQAGTVDLFLCETLSTLAEIDAAVAAAAESGLPVWAALTVDDDDGALLRSGAPVAEAAAAARAAGASAVLANCSTPEAVEAAMAPLAEAGPPFGGYPNGFVSVAPQAAEGVMTRMEARRDLGPNAYAARVAPWAGRGATILGGCCEVGPGHIAALRARLEADGRRLAPAPRRAA